MEPGRPGGYTRRHSHARPTAQHPTGAIEGIAREIAAGADGCLRLLVLPVGTYRVAVEADGFARFLRGEVPVSVGQMLRIDVQLDVSGLTDAVEVVGGAPLVDQAGQFGTAGRNIARGPSYRNLDVSLVRTFAVSDASRLQFRVEAFNVTNVVNFGLPVADLHASNFGRILSAGPPRLMQFALKYMF